MKRVKSVEVLAGSSEPPRLHQSIYKPLIEISKCAAVFNLKTENTRSRTLCSNIKKEKHTHTQKDEETKVVSVFLRHATGPLLLLLGTTQEGEDGERNEGKLRGEVCSPVMTCYFM